MKKCEQCRYYVLDNEKPSISRCRERASHLGEGVYMMAREQRLSNNRCGPGAVLWEPKTPRGN